MGTTRRRHNCCNILQSHQKCQFPKCVCAHHEITYIHVGVEMEWHWDGVNCSTNKLLDTIVEEATTDAQACETLLKILSVEKERSCDLVIQQGTMKADLETKKILLEQQLFKQRVLYSSFANNCCHICSSSQVRRRKMADFCNRTSVCNLFLSGGWLLEICLLPGTLGTKVETKKYPAVGSFLLY